MPAPRLGKYACLELERRYLLRHLPPDWIEDGPYWRIVDRYIVNTRLRLRRMTSATGQPTIYKFGQKYQGASQHETQRTMTNMYLDEAEYHALAQLEAREVVKRRYRYEHKGGVYSIDLFEGKLTGLILAEIEAQTEAELAELTPPRFALKEVTDDPFFTGGHLAMLTEQAFQLELARRLGDEAD